MLATVASAATLSCRPAWEGPPPTEVPVDRPPVEGISVPEGRRHLVWRGEPLVLVGDSVTHAWMEAGADFDYRAWLDALAGRGINAALLWAYIGSSVARRSEDRRIGYAAPTLWPWCGSVTAHDMDLGCFNDEYFRRLRDFVAYADSRGIVIVLTVHDGWPKERFDAHPFNAALGNGPLASGEQYVDLAHYGREMGPDLDPQWDRAQRNQYYQERFGARLIEALDGYGNVVYEMFNEGEWYDAARRRLHELHFLQFFRARTAAPLASNVDHIKGGNLRRDPRVDIASLHRPRWDETTEVREIFAHFAAETAREPAVPVLFSETVPAWQGALEELDALTRLAWGALLGGGHVLVQNDTSFRFARQSGMADRAAEGRLLLDRLGHVSDFATIVDLTAMQPDSQLCSTRICMALPGLEYVVYAQAREALWVNLADVSADAVESRWYDPRTGRMTAAEIAVPARRVRFTPPFADAVLHVRVQ